LIHVVHTLPDWAYVNVDTVDRMFDVEAEARIVFCGHTHRPSIYSLKSGKHNAKVRRLNPRGEPVVVPYEPNTRYVVDAGSLARPVGGRRQATECATYAVFDMEQGTIGLHGIDKTERMKALYEEMLARAHRDDDTLTERFAQPNRPSATNTGIADLETCLLRTQGEYHAGPNRSVGGPRATKSSRNAD